MKMEFFPKILMRGIREHFGRYAHALRFAVGQGCQVFYLSVTDSTRFIMKTKSFSFMNIFD